MEAFLYFALWVAVSLIALRIGIGVSASHNGRNRTDSSTGNLRWVPPEADTDPVCGRTVVPEQAKSSVYDGCVYYFCSRECREQFEAAPEIYIEALIPDRASEPGGRR